MLADQRIGHAALPALLDLAGRDVVALGDNAAPVRRAWNLAEASAQIWFLVARLPSDLAEAGQRGDVRLLARDWGMAMDEKKGQPRTTDEAVVAISAARGGRGSALKVVTANRLSDGIVVYFANGSTWAERIADARTVEGKDAAAVLLAEAEADVTSCHVVNPYLIDVACGADGLLRPSTYREIIRAAGPSTRPEFAKEAVEG